VSTGLFLTPGAARTAYQVGAVQELVHAGTRFDVIAASSVGTLNGAFVATGQVDLLASLWASWRTSDITGADWPELLRGGVLWARNLMHNRPQKHVLDEHLAHAPLLPRVRLRFNLANLTTGGQDVVEWPPGPVPLPDGVNASVAVPGAIRPAEIGGEQVVDGLVVDGFPLEELLLSTGVDRAFVVGVAPLAPIDRPVRSAYASLLRAVEWNQYGETLRGLESAERVNALVRSWAEDRRAAEDAVTRLPVEEAVRERLLVEIARTYDEAGFPYARGPVEIVPVLPAEEIAMFFVAYDPQRSRRLLEQGRRDARAALDRLAS